MALSGLKVIELMGLAPGPFCGNILADFGASVTVIHKVGQAVFADVLTNGKRLIAINLKHPEGVKIMKKMCKASDVLVDTYRPGVMEKLGLGPQVISKVNSQLIYARLTGYGQDGYYKDKGGHDINYIAMSGVLSLLSTNNEPPSPPTNIIGDFAGGSVMCVLGILLALLERSKSGKGQIVDASMTESVAYIATWIFKNQKSLWCMPPGSNSLDGGAPFYNTYLTKDGKFMAVGALEPQFYHNLLKGLNLSPEIYGYMEYDLCKNKFQEVFLTKTQSEWCEIFENLDACVTPILDVNMVDKHKCNMSRKTFFRDDNDLVMPEPAPKLSMTPGISSHKMKPTTFGENTVEILNELGYNKIEINKLIKEGIVEGNVKSNL